MSGDASTTGRSLNDDLLAQVVEADLHDVELAPRELVEKREAGHASDLRGLAATDETLLLPLDDRGEAHLRGELPRRHPQRGKGLLRNLERQRHHGAVLRGRAEAAAPPPSLCTTRGLRQVPRRAWAEATRDADCSTRDVPLPAEACRPKAGYGALKGGRQVEVAADAMQRQVRQPAGQRA